MYPNNIVSETLIIFKLQVINIYLPEPQVELLYLFSSVFAVPFWLRIPSFKKLLGCLNYHNID